MHQTQRLHRPSHGGPRIPIALQAVLLDGNRGIVVNTPPSDRSANTTFRGIVVNSPPPDKSANTAFLRWRWLGRPEAKEVTRKEKLQNEYPKKDDASHTPVVPKPNKKKKSAPLPTLSPQQYLDAMIRTRGYSAETYATLSSAYHNKPTPYQLASYGAYTIDLIRTCDTKGLKEVFTLGVSPNACNVHGESILHNVCRRYDVNVLDVLLHAGCDVQVSDDNGRTPLHDACWATEPNFPLVEKLLERDIRLLYMADHHGHLPLSYTRQAHWSEWLQFLQSKKDVYWPKNTNNNNCNDYIAAPALALMEPNSRPIPDPKNAMSLQILHMLAEGKVKPNEIYLLTLLEQEDDSSKRDDESDFDEVFDDESSSCYDSDELSDEDDSTEPTATFINDSDDLNASWNVKEMNDVLDSLNSPVKRPLVW